MGGVGRPTANAVRVPNKWRKPATKNMKIKQIGTMRKGQNGRIYSQDGQSPTLSGTRAGTGTVVPFVLVSPKLTPTPPMSSDTTTPMLKTMATVPKSTGVKYPTLICLSEEARVKISPLLERELGLLGLGLGLPTSISGRLKKSVPLDSFGKMYEVYFQVTEDGTLSQYSIKWPKQGILSNGKFSTPSTSVSLKTESVSLSSVLVQTSEVPEKYFLKEEYIEKLLEYNRRQIANNRGFSATPRVSDGISPALKIGGGGEGRPRIRRLMPIECERLMSWPDGHTSKGRKEDGTEYEVSDTQRYKMCGNGVVSEVVRNLVEQLYATAPRIT